MKDGRIPEHLEREVLAGHCVAFVGSGFSQPTVPGWAGLLERVAATMGGRAQALAAELDPRSTHLDYEMVAQRLKELDAGAFLAALREHCTGLQVEERNQRRRRWLFRIPFSSILTTNFDRLLPGEPRSAEGYRRVLRPAEPWFSAQYWGHLYPWSKGEQHRRGRSRRVLALHGSLTDEGSVVVTAQDYRRLLFKEPGYMQFLRTVFATKTVLFLGFSFTDAYINLLRSEILALLEHRGAGESPWAYAAMSGVREERRDYLRHYEGLYIIPCSEEDYREFDELLEELYCRTNPAERLARLLEGRHVLWCDRQPENNRHGIRFLRCVARLGERLVLARTPEEALRWLREARPRFDLVLTQWGHGGAGERSVAQRLLLGMRQGAPESFAPVLVIASGDYADENKAEALRYGAYDYVYRWDTLFRRIEELCTSGYQTG
jgi:CheY-like chemotaxis protein